jgi:stage II sporulation protein P
MRGGIHTRRPKPKYKKRGTLRRLLLLALCLSVLWLAASGGAESLRGRILSLFAPELPTVIESAAPVPTEPAIPSDEPAPKYNTTPTFTFIHAERELYTPELRNETSYVPDMDALPAAVTLDPAVREPQVLIVHTHSSESYTSDAEYAYEQDDTDRTLDERYNVNAVGDRVAETLEAAGIAVLHDKSVNDYPSYNGSYSRTLGIIEGYLAEYPSIKIVLDIHRDAVIYDDGSRFATRVNISGKSAARVMLVVGTDEGGKTHEDWEYNLALAAKLQTAADERYPGLMRPINVQKSRYNQHVSHGALIVEVGASGNTLGEALYGGELFGKIVAENIL